MTTGSWLLIGFNLTSAAVFALICVSILRGLARTSQVRRNILALTAAGIFAASAGHRLLYGLQLAVTPAAAGTAFLANPLEWVILGTDAVGAVIGVVYLVFRGRDSRPLPTSGLYTDESEDRYRQLASNLPNTFVMLFDLDERILLADGALAEFGMTSASVEGKRLGELMSPATVEHLRPYWLQTLQGGEIDLDHHDEASGRTVHVRIRPILGSDGRVVGGVAFSENVTAARAIQRDLREALMFNQAVLDASPDIAVTHDLTSGEILWASRNLWEMLGWSEADRARDQRTSLAELVLPDDRAVITAANESIARLADGQSVTVRFRMLGGSGEYHWISRRSTPFRHAADGRVIEALSIVREVTDAINAEHQLQHAALHDPLTGLPNRTLLMDRISSAIDRVDRDNTEVAVLFCDLDNFKRINDTAGHAAGDAVLVEVAERLRHALRKGDSIARVGGDEFVIVLEPSVMGPHHGGAADHPADDRPAGDQRRAQDTETAAETEHLDTRQVAELVAHRIIAALNRPIVYRGHEIDPSISIGVTFARRGSLASDVLRDADTAMYLAKQRGRDRFEIFDDSLRAELIEREQVEHALRDALAAQSAAGNGSATGKPSGAALKVAYQPVYDLASGELVSFEALARLTGASGEPIPPDVFIPIAESSGLISSVGASILEQAASGLSRWRRLSGENLTTGLSVNISARQAQQDDLTTLVTEILGRHGLEPSDLTLELTESILLEAGSSGMRRLSALHAMGVGIAIDDFGTGYASLSYLTTLPITALKIDKSFTAGLPEDSASSTIVRAITALAAELGLLCVVEGIESDVQLNSLPPGVLGQGYLLGKPDTDITRHRLPSPRRSPELVRQLPEVRGTAADSGRR